VVVLGEGRRHHRLGALELLLRRITHVSGSYESPYGEIGSEWRVEEGGRVLFYEATVPANTQATLHLPAASADAVHEGRNPLADVDGVRFLGYPDAVASYQLPSGRYRLTSRLT
jgi:alpha-L-rhamnosidase